MPGMDGFPRQRCLSQQSVAAACTCSLQSELHDQHKKSWKTIMYLFSPKVRGNLPALTATREDSLFEQALGCWDPPWKPRYKATHPWKDLVSYKLQLITAPVAEDRLHLNPISIAATWLLQLIAVLLGRHPGCCPRHSSPQVRRCFCSLSGYCSAAVPRKRKALGWQGQRKQKAQYPDARMHGEQTSTGQLRFQKYLPLGFVIPPKGTVTCLRDVFVSPSATLLTCRAIWAAFPEKNLSCSHASEQLLPACLVWCLEEKHFSFQENNLHLYNILSRVPLVRNAWWFIRQCFSPGRT